MKTAFRLSNTISMAVQLTLYVCGTSATAAGQQLPDAIDRVRPSIVQVSVDCVYANNSVVTYGGTAFLVSKEGFALTAAHVVACTGGALASQRVKVGLPLVYSVTDQTQKRGNFTFIDAVVVERENVRDVALLKLSKNPFGEEIASGYTLEGKPLRMMPLGVAVLSSRALREGEPVAASGFPFISPVLCTDAGIVASTRDTHYFDTEGEGLHVRVAFDFYLADMTVNHGNSGGPVYDASGEIIGIVSGFKVAEVEKFVHGAWQQAPSTEESYGYNSRLAVVVPIANAKILLSKHAISN